jgi:hypothetical protein
MEIGVVSITDSIPVPLRAAGQKLSGAGGGRGPGWAVPVAELALLT